MPRTVKHESTMAHSRESSFVSLLTGWAQQGVENFFATQRILVDLVTRQNADAMNMLRERLADPAYCPAAILTELTGEGVTNFIEGQKLLLNLAQQEYELVANGLKERVGGLPIAVAADRFHCVAVWIHLSRCSTIFSRSPASRHTPGSTAVKAGKGL